MNKLRKYMKTIFCNFLFRSVKTLQKNQGQLYIVEKSLLVDKFSVILHHLNSKVYQFGSW